MYTIYITRYNSSFTGYTDYCYTFVSYVAAIKFTIDNVNSGVSGILFVRYFNGQKKTLLIDWYTLKSIKKGYK